jgi:hypothetical protein
MKKVAGYIWENLKIVLKALWEALSSFGAIVFTAAKTGIAWLWDTGISALSTFIENLTPFIPLPTLLKLNIVVFNENILLLILVTKKCLKIIYYTLQ